MNNANRTLDQIFAEAKQNLKKKSDEELNVLLDKFIAWFEYKADEIDPFPETREQIIEYILDGDPIAVDGGLISFFLEQGIIASK